MSANDERALCEALRAQAEEVQAARDALESARSRLTDLAVQAIKAGVRQRDVAALSGYTRETVRRIARRAGIGPT